MNSYGEGIKKKNVLSISRYYNLIGMCGGKKSLVVLFTTEGDLF